jgi:hypothetical protein
VLSECWNRRESKTGKSGKYKKGSKKTKPTHNPYLPSNAGVHFRAKSLSTRSPYTRTVRPYIIRFYLPYKGLFGLFWGRRRRQKR